MNAVIREFEGMTDEDLVICSRYGVAYQKDMSKRIEYDDAYLDKFAAYDRAIARAVNAGRCAFLSRHLPHGASVLDIGAGDGAFVRAARDAGFDAKGYEVIPAAVNALKAAELYDYFTIGYVGFTAWDVIEHMPDPASWFNGMCRPGVMLFVSLPIFEDLHQIRESKHYRPSEHLYYFSRDGFVSWAGHYGFTLLEFSDHEMRAGREQIGAFAFRKEADKC